MKVLTKKALDRRSFLRGAGASLALPFLDAMIPAFAGTSQVVTPPLRLGYIYLPIGRIMEDWTPGTVGGVRFELPLGVTLKHEVPGGCHESAVIWKRVVHRPADFATRGVEGDEFPRGMWFAVDLGQ